MRSTLLFTLNALPNETYTREQRPAPLQSAGRRGPWGQEHLTHQSVTAAAELHHDFLEEGYRSPDRVLADPLVVAMGSGDLFRGGQERREAVGDDPQRAEEHALRRPRQHLGG